jgi:hypothetical protein
MSEDILKQFSLTVLFGLMVQSLKDLLEAENKNDELEIKMKKEQVALLQRIFIFKRAEFSPVN